MKVSDEFKKVIKAYLDQRAIDDELFAVTYAKPAKNIDECCAYILNTVQQSECNGFEDKEIFNMAVHYYDEDNIKVGKIPNCRVVVNHIVELTEEEKNTAKEAAIKQIENEFYTSLKKKSAKHKKANDSTQQMTLF